MRSLYTSYICIFVPVLSFTCIPNMFFNTEESSRAVIGGGDFNCRVGNITQRIPMMGASYRPNVDAETNERGIR